MPTPRCRALPPCAGAGAGDGTRQFCRQPFGCVQPRTPRHGKRPPEYPGRNSPGDRARPVSAPDCQPQEPLRQRVQLCLPQAGSCQAFRHAVSFPCRPQTAVCALVRGGFTQIQPHDGVPLCRQHPDVPEGAEVEQVFPRAGQCRLPCVGGGAVQHPDSPPVRRGQEQAVQRGGVRGAEQEHDLPACLPGTPRYSAHKTAFPGSGASLDDVQCVRPGARAEQGGEVILKPVLRIGGGKPDLPRPACVFLRVHTDFLPLRRLCRQFYSQSMENGTLR